MADVSGAYSVKDRLYISHSSRGTLSGCARKFEFIKLYEHRHFDDSRAGDVGKAIHEGYQEWLRSRDEDRALWSLMRHYPYQSTQYTTDKIWNPTDDRSLEACAVTLRAMVDAAGMAEYELANIRTIQGAIVPAVEVPFEIRFTNFVLPGNVSVSYIGYIDSILFNRLNGRYRTIDVKSTRQSLFDATPKYKFDTQMIPYQLVLNHVLNEPIDSVEVLYLHAYIDLLEPRVDVYPFMKDRSDVQDWFANVILDLRALKSYMQMDYFPRTEHGCLSFNRPCPFLDVCGTRDKATIQRIFLQGEPPSPPRPFEPWIQFDVEIPEAA